MKKLYKRVITYLLIFILSVICVKPMNVSAYGGFFTTDSFSKTGTWTDSNNVSHAAYVMQDDSSLQSGFRYYMRVGDGVAIACDGSEVIANILNYKIGLVMSANILSNFITSYIQDTSLLGREPTYFEHHPPVLKGGAIVGVALNELTGCRMAYAESNDTVNIPSDVSNDVYNYYINVYLIDNPETPDFINVGTLSNSEVSGMVRGLYTDYVTPPHGDYNFGYERDEYTCRAQWSQSSYRNNEYGFISGADFYFVAQSGFDGVVNAFSLDKNNYTVDAVRAWQSSTSVNLLCKAKLISETGYKKFGSCSFPSDPAQGANVTENASSTCSVLFVGGDKSSIPFSNQGYFTVYKNETIVTQITNNTYAPSTYQTNNYQNYSTSNDNSYTTNVQNVNNSSSNNTNIYNQAKTETNETIVEDSYNVNTTTTTTNITNITNNYYGDNGSGGSGGGDDDGGDDDDDDTIWKALLKAIGDFLKKIGELIATVLTGIISILTSVLDAIANITTSFSAITDFLGAVFGFLPSDLVAVITLGVTLGILISLIKMFGK